METPDVVNLPDNEEEWAAGLQKAHIDYIPDPMVLRARQL